MPSPEVVCSRTMTWPLFSPPRTGAGDLHALEDVLVADRRAHDLAAGRLDGRPGGRRSRGPRRRAAARQRAATEPVEREDAQDLVAVDDLAVASTAISRSASPSSANPTSAPRATTASASEAGIGGAAADVDVHPVGLGVDDLDRRAGRAPGSRGPSDGSPSRWRRRARAGVPVGVDRAPRARAGARRSRRRGRGVTTIRPRPALVDAAELLRAPDELLELVLDRVVELEAVAVEDLEPVVVGRVVRGRDHDPGGERAAPREERERRRRARRRRRGRRRRGWLAPAAIAATNMSPERRVSWPTTIAPPGLDEAMRGRPAEGVRQRRLEVDVGDAADAVGAEQAGHRRLSRPRSGLARPAGDDGDGDGRGGSVTVTRTVSGLAARASGRRAGRPSRGPPSCPGRGRLTSRSATRVDAVEPVEVGDRPADASRGPGRRRHRVVEVGALARRAGRPPRTSGWT